MEALGATVRAVVAAVSAALGRHLRAAHLVEALEERGPEAQA
jgi:hypothetical protein